MIKTRLNFRRVTGMVMVVVGSWVGMGWAQSQEEAVSSPKNLQTKPVAFYFDVQPVSGLFCPGGSEFSMSDNGDTETIDFGGFWSPSAKAGISIKTGDIAHIDLGLGSGLLVNPWMDGGYGLADAAVNFRVGDAITVGPHLGLVYFSDMNVDSFDLFDDDSDDQTEVSFDGHTGYLLGVKSNYYFTRHISLLMTVDYLSATLDVDDVEDRDAFSDELDLSGIGIGLGVQFKF